MTPVQQENKDQAERLGVDLSTLSVEDIFDIIPVNGSSNGTRTDWSKGRNITAELAHQGRTVKKDGKFRAPKVRGLSDRGFALRARNEGGNDDGVYLFTVVVKSK